MNNLPPPKKVAPGARSPQVSSCYGTVCD